MANKCCVCGKGFAFLDTPIYIRKGSPPLCADCYKRIFAVSSLASMLLSRNPDPYAFAEAYISAHEAIGQSGFPENVVSELQQEVDGNVEDYYNRHTGFKELVESSPAFRGERRLNYAQMQGSGGEGSSGEGHIKPGLCWYKFIIYIQLIVTPFTSLGYAALIFTGLIYKESRDVVYAMFPNIKSINWIYAVLLLGAGVFALYVRQELAHFKKNAPAKYLLFSIIPLVLSLGYSLVVFLFFSAYAAGVMVSESITNWIVILIMVICNCIYFSHRAYLFIN